MGLYKKENSVGQLCGYHERETTDGEFVFTERFCHINAKLALLQTPILRTHDKLFLWNLYGPLKI